MQQFLDTVYVNHIGEDQLSLLVQVSIKEQNGSRTTDLEEVLLSLPTGLNDDQAHVLAYAALEMRGRVRPPECRRKSYKPVDGIAFYGVTLGDACCMSPDKLSIVANHWHSPPSRLKLSGITPGYKYSQHNS